MGYMRMHSDLCDATPKRGMSARQHPLFHVSCSLTAFAGGITTTITITR